MPYNSVNNPDGVKLLPKHEVQHQPINKIKNVQSRHNRISNDNYMYSHLGNMSSLRNLHNNEIKTFDKRIGNTPQPSINMYTKLTKLTTNKAKLISIRFLMSKDDIVFIL